MDDLTLVGSFRAELADDDPRARTAAWLALEARFDQATAPVRAPRGRREGLSPGRRRLLVFSSVAAAAAIIAGVLVLGSGPTAEPAVAEVLRRTATVAAAGDDAPPALPGPGKFLYSKTKVLEFTGWVAGGRPVSHGGPLNTPHTPLAFGAPIPLVREGWISQYAAGRTRETMDTPRFLSAAERSRWQRAGSPLPGRFDPSNQAGEAELMTRTGGRVLEARRESSTAPTRSCLPASGPTSGFPICRTCRPSRKHCAGSSRQTRLPAWATPRTGCGSRSTAKKRSRACSASSASGTPLPRFVPPLSMRWQNYPASSSTATPPTSPDVRATGSAMKTADTGRVWRTSSTPRPQWFWAIGGWSPTPGDRRRTGGSRQVSCSAKPPTCDQVSSTRSANEPTVVDSAAATAGRVDRR